MRPRFLLLLLFFSLPVFAQLRLHVRNPEEVYAEQRRVVSSWCRQDFTGLRLNSEGWNRYKSLTNIKDNPDQSTVVIISRYQVGGHDPQSISWDVNVNYVVIGRYERSSGYAPDGGTETVTFRTKDVDGDIVITEVDPASPHVSKKAALDWLKQQLASTTSDVEKFHLANAIKQLEPPSSTAATQSPAE
ncbi:MAG: hypothetical protein ACM3JB_09905 [Acidobacteriaceae bacterium]